MSNQARLTQEELDTIKVGDKVIYRIPVGDGTAKNYLHTVTYLDKGELGNTLVGIDRPYDDVLTETCVDNPEDTLILIKQDIGDCGELDEHGFFKDCDAKDEDGIYQYGK